MVFVARLSPSAWITTVGPGRVVGMGVWDGGTSSRSNKLWPGAAVDIGAWSDTLWLGVGVDVVAGAASARGR